MIPDHNITGSCRSGISKYKYRDIITMDEEIMNSGQQADMSEDTASDTAEIEETEQPKYEYEDSEDFPASEMISDEDVGQEIDEVPIQSGEKFIESFLSYAPAGFAGKYSKEIEAASALDWSRPEEAAEKLRSSGTDEDLADIITAFAMVSARNYEEPGIRYDKMFSSGIIPDHLLEDIKEFVGDMFSEVIPAQVNASNAGYYFAIMTGDDSDNYISSDMIVRPNLVDVFGSDWCREPISRSEREYAVNNFWCCVPPLLNAAHGSVSDEDAPAGKQLCGSLEDDILASKSQWLLLDMSSLVCQCLYRRNGCIFSDISGSAGEKDGAEKLQPADLASVTDPEQETGKAFCRFLDLIKAKYGQQIILINGRISSYSLGSDGKLTSDGIDHSQENELLGNAYLFARKRLGCYGISFAEGFVPCGTDVSSASPSHGNDIYNDTVNKLIKYVISEMPVKKNYLRCSGEAWLKNLISLASGNSMSEIADAVRLDRVDECILALGADDMKKYSSMLAKVYDYEKLYMDKLLENFDFGRNKDLKAKLASAAGLDPVK